MKVTIEKIFETQTFGSNGFKKREWVGVDYSNQTYPQYLKFELLKDACEKIDEFTEGQVVDVEFNIRGNKYDNPEKGVQYFVSLQSWKITANNGTGDITPEHSANQSIAIGESDALPF